MKAESVRVAIWGGALGGLVVGLMAYAYMRYKIATFGGSQTAKQGVQVTVPGSMIAGWVADVGHGL